MARCRTSPPYLAGPLWHYRRITAPKEKALQGLEMFSSRSRVSALAVLSFFRTAPALAADVGTWFGNPATTWQAGGSTSPVPAAVTTFANTTGTSSTCHYANVVDPTPGQFGRCA